MSKVTFKEFKVIYNKHVENIVAFCNSEMQTKIATLSVGEAVMQMELDSAPVLVFRNTSHGGVNVVYQRADGNVGWIDPRNLSDS